MHFIEKVQRTCQKWFAKFYTQDLSLNNPSGRQDEVVSKHYIRIINITGNNQWTQLPNQMLKIIYTSLVILVTTLLYDLNISRKENNFLSENLKKQVA